MAFKESKPSDCLTCNTMDIGSVLDNSETSVTLTKEYKTYEEAMKAQENYDKTALEANPKAETSFDITESTLFTLVFHAKFECQAEVLIFQLKNR